VLSFGVLALILKVTTAHNAVQKFTEISIVVLLVGTLVGGFVQTGEIFSTGALSYAPDTVPDWIQARSGSFLMVLAVCFIIFPASLVEVMTQARPPAFPAALDSCGSQAAHSAHRHPQCTQCIQSQAAHMRQRRAREKARCGRRGLCLFGRPLGPAESSGDNARILGQKRNFSGSCNGQEVNRDTQAAARVCS